MKRSSKIVFLVLALALAAGLGFAVFKVQQQADREVIENAGASEHADHSNQYLTYQDVKYPVLRNMTSLLLIGTDNFVDDAKQPERDDLYWNRNLNDFNVILVFDHDKKTVTPFQINRDTITTVPWLTINHMIGGYYYAHFCYAHTYGSGKNDSCENVVTTARMLLHDAPIDYYFSFTMDAVPVVNDMVGGVDVTLEEDLPALGEEYVKGATIHLEGNDALRFVRHRRKDIVNANYYRMLRHRQYLTGFLEAAHISLEKNSDLFMNIYKRIDPYLCTNLTVNTMSDLVNDMMEYEILPVVSPDGEYVQGPEYFEFYPDEQSLWDCVYQAFCRKT